DEVIKLLKKIKDSVTLSGGMIGEVKAQQRDLRGEVLHMGRDIARKIDETHQQPSNALAITDGQSRQEIAQIVQQGLTDLKAHLDNVMREKRRQSSSTVMSSSSVNSKEVYDVVKHALAERGLDAVQPAQMQDAGLTKEAVLEAVKEAYEAYKPEIELQQFGLEREEILQCLKEGLEDYRENAPRETGISRDEVLDAVHEAMQGFQPPPTINEGREIRDEVLSAVRECLEDLKLPSQSSQQSFDIDITRGIMLDAVKQGLSTHGPGAPREIEISREDLFEAVRAGLDHSGISPEQVWNRLHELVDAMRSEFKSYSAANGRDTEQVLDAMKDGLESLRAEIESYVDR
ncbi:hypothetical protein LTS18_001967, partial [Coniosporium uncinatum]